MCLNYSLPDAFRHKGVLLLPGDVVSRSLNVRGKAGQLHSTACLVVSLSYYMVLLVRDSYFGRCVTNNL